MGVNTTGLLNTQTEVYASYKNDAVTKNETAAKKDSTAKTEEKNDVYDCFFLKNNACNDKASNMEWPWDFAVDDESILIIDKFHYFIRAVLEKNLPLQEYILKFMQFAEENKDTIVIADEIGNGIVPLDAFEREYREQTGRAEILLAKKADEVVRVICGIGQKIK